MPRSLRNDEIITSTRIFEVGVFLNQISKRVEVADSLIVTSIYSATMKDFLLSINVEDAANATFDLKKYILACRIVLRKINLNILMYIF